MELVWTAIIAECARMIADTGNEPPSITDYNVFLAGTFAAALLSALPPTIGHVDATSTGDLYDYFEARKSNKLVSE